MSIHAIKWAWGQECPNPTSKLVLVALADHANSDGECWPTMKLVAELAGVSTRSVHNHIKALEGAGLVTRLDRRKSGGQYRGWMFRLHLTDDSATGSQLPLEVDDQRQPASDSSGSQVPVPVATGFRSGTTNEPPENLSADGPSHQELFDALFKVCGYSGKLPKSEAGKIAKVAKELREIGATPDDVKAKAKAYRTKWPDITLTPTGLLNNYALLDADENASTRKRRLCFECDRPLDAPNHDRLCAQLAGVST